MSEAKVHWLNPEGASSEALQELRSTAPSLPERYLHLLALGNGGEVGLSASPYTLCLDPAEVALDCWRSEDYRAMSLFVFGGNGGAELLAFKFSVQNAPTVVSFDPIDPDGSAREVANSFESFLELVAQ